MVSVYQRRVWTCMEVLRHSAPHLNLDSLEELFGKDFVAGAALQDLEHLAMLLQDLRAYTMLPWWKRVLGWTR